MENKNSNKEKDGVTETHEKNAQINKEIKEQYKLYFQKWSITFSLSFFILILSIFLTVVENNSISGYKLIIRQQYNKSLLGIQKSVNSISSIIKIGENHKRQRRSEDIINNANNFFTLTYPYKPHVLAMDSIQTIEWDITEELKNKKMDIILKNISSSSEGIIIARNVDLNSKKATWRVNSSVTSGNYNLEFRLKNYQYSFLGSSPVIIISSLNINDKNYYPNLIKFTYPYAPMDWKINDKSLVTWNPLPFAQFSSTFKLSICEFTSANNNYDISEFLIHPEVQASNGYYKINLKKIKGVSPGKQYFFKATFSSGVFEVSSLFNVVDEINEAAYRNKDIEIIKPYTSKVWRIGETVNISLNIKRYALKNIGKSYLRLLHIDTDKIMNSNDNNSDNSFIIQFTMKKRSNNENQIVKIKDIKKLEDSQTIWNVPKDIKRGFYSIQLINIGENENESIIDQTSPIIEIIP